MPYLRVLFFLISISIIPMSGFGTDTKNDTLPKTFYIIRKNIHGQEWIRFYPDEKGLGRWICETESLPFREISRPPLDLQQFEKLAPSLQTQTSRSKRSQRQSTISIFHNLGPAPQMYQGHQDDPLFRDLYQQINRNCRHWI